MKIRLPLDSAAVALGADEVAAALMAEAAHRGVALELVRNGSRGMVWLEPLAEVEIGAMVAARDAAGAAASSARGITATGRAVGATASDST